MDLINFKSRDVAKQELKGLKPTTKQEAIKLIHILSLITSASKDIKTSCYAFLSNKCADCAHHEDKETGLEVTLVAPDIKTYKSSEELVVLGKEQEELSAKMKILTGKIKKAQDEAGFETSPGVSYWKASGK